MPVPSTITDLSATAASNSPAGTDAVFPDLDNYLRAHAAFIRQGDTKATTIASAATTDLGLAAGRIVDVSGTATITSFGTAAAGVWRIVRATGAFTLTHNATSLILPGGLNITTVSGDALIAVSLGSGNWVVTHFQSASSDARFSVERQTVLSVTAPLNSPETVTFEVARFNYAAAFNVATGVFTAPVAGDYVFNVRFLWEGDTTTDLAAYLVRNNVDTVSYARAQNVDALAAYGTLVLNDTLALAAGDTVRVKVARNQLRSVVINPVGVGATSGRTVFSGYRLK